MLLTTKHQQPGLQPADIFGGGQNDCNLLFYVRTTEVWALLNCFSKFRDAVNPPLAGLPPTNIPLCKLSRHRLNLFQCVIDLLLYSSIQCETIDLRQVTHLPVLLQIKLSFYMFIT